METDMSVKNKAGSIFSSKTVWVCIGLGLIVLIAVTIFKVPFGTLLFSGALLAFPLLHILMMRDGGHKQ